MDYTIYRIDDLATDGGTGSDRTVCGTVSGPQITDGQMALRWACAQRLIGHGDRACAARARSYTYGDCRLTIDGRTPRLRAGDGRPVAISRQEACYLLLRWRRIMRGTDTTVLARLLGSVVTLCDRMGRVIGRGRLELRNGTYNTCSRGLTGRDQDRDGSQQWNYCEFAARHVLAVTRDKAGRAWLAIDR